MGKHNEFGKQGEQIAVEYLIKQGYKIQCRNYRYMKAEIDVIAQKAGVLVIVEVKSRSSEFIENIAETVTKKKINLLIMAAHYYVVERDLEVDVRFDIVTILKNKGVFSIEHLENAFYHF